MPERARHSGIRPPRPLNPTPRPLEARQLLREASLELARLRRIRGASHKTWRRIARAQARLAFAAALLAAPLAEPALAGTPSFRALTPGVVGTSSWPAHAQVAPDFVDIDADGDLDAFVGENGRTIFFENTGTAGTPAFAGPAANPFGLVDVGFDAAPALADIDGDGDLDAFVGNYDGNTVFFRNTGTASAPAIGAPLTNRFGLTDVGFRTSLAAWRRRDAR